MQRLVMHLSVFPLQTYAFLNLSNLSIFTPYTVCLSQEDVMLKHKHLNKREYPAV